MSVRIDLTGKRFGCVVVQSFSHCDGIHACWTAVCDCGKIFITRRDRLKSGRTRSCGCGILYDRPDIPQPDDPLIRFIPLTHGYFSVVDTEDYDRASRYRFHLSKTPQGLLYAGGGPEKLLHKLILPCPDGYEVDHIDGDGLNNRRSNLRVATHSQNCANRKMRSDNKSGYKGVSWNKQMQKWHAQCRYLGKNYRLGYFDDVLDAAKAYQGKQLELYKEFAKW